MKNNSNSNKWLDINGWFIKINSADLINSDIQNSEIQKLQKEAEEQKSKEQIQADIMSYFIKNPENDISTSISLSNQDGYEIVTIWWDIRPVITLEASEDFKNFTKEYVIDKKTNSKWVLFIWKEWFILENVVFDDISMFDIPYKTYFLYKENWTIKIKLIKYDKNKIYFETENLEKAQELSEQIRKED